MALWVALVGGAVGSFLNVVIARVPAGESIVHPRSRCPRCGARIRWFDNVPVVSWLVLRGRCRACRAPMSMRSARRNAPRYIAIRQENFSVRATIEVNAGS